MGQKRKGKSACAGAGEKRNAVAALALPRRQNKNQRRPEGAPLAERMFRLTVVCIMGADRLLRVPAF